MFILKIVSVYKTVFNTNSKYKYNNHKTQLQLYYILRSLIKLSDTKIIKCNLSFCHFLWQIACLLKKKIINYLRFLTLVCIIISKCIFVKFQFKRTLNTTSSITLFSYSFYLFILKAKRLVLLKFYIITNFRKSFIKILIVKTA